jgi:sulfite exporter TauE/SafE
MYIQLISALFLGVIAGLSTCSALLGGVVLSVSKHYPGPKIQAGLLFNFGRLVSFSLLGFLLGLLGNSFSLSPVLGAVVTLVVAIAMLLLGLQMAGVRAFRRWQPPTIKSLANFVSNENNHGKQIAALSLGFLSLLLPCGFTLAAEGLALASKSPIAGMLILLTFAIGTALVLLGISLASKSLASRPILNKVAGGLIAFFSLIIAIQSLGVLGLPLPEVSFGSQNTTVPSEVAKDQQVVKMRVESFGYSPNNFTIKVGVPVRWEITSDGTPTCANYLVVPSLNINKIIQSGVNIIEFTPRSPGQIRFSCSMGMYRGVFNVI